MCGVTPCLRTAAPGGTVSRLRLKFSPPGSRGHPHSLHHEVSEHLHEHFTQTQLPTAANTAPSHTDRSLKTRGFHKDIFTPDSARTQPPDWGILRNEANITTNPREQQKTLQPHKFWGCLRRKELSRPRPFHLPAAGQPQPARGLRGEPGTRHWQQLQPPLVPSVSPKLTSHGSRPPSCSW